MNVNCPKCLGVDVSAVGTSHYVCNNPKCLHNGARTQFKVIADQKVCFPYNQIFVGRPRTEFIRKPYLQLEDVGVANV